MFVEVPAFETRRRSCGWVQPRLGFNSVCASELDCPCNTAVRRLFSVKLDCWFCHGILFSCAKDSGADCCTEEVQAREHENMVDGLAVFSNSMESFSSTQRQTLQKNHRRSFVWSLLLALITTHCLSFRSAAIKWKENGLTRLVLRSG